MFSVTMTESPLPVKRVVGEVVSVMHDIKWSVDTHPAPKDETNRRGLCRKCGAKFKDTDALRRACLGEGGGRSPLPGSAVRL